LFGSMAGCALVFGLLNWLGVPPGTGLVILAILVVSVVAATALLVVIAGPKGRAFGWPI